MNHILIIGYIAALCTTTAFIPQVIHALRTKSTKDISLHMYLIFSVGILFWTIYGLFINSFPIILANGITLALAVTVLIQKIRYG